MKYSAVGCHVFAGGFTMGVKRVMDVDTQLEVFELGNKTAESIGVNVARADDPRDWPRMSGHLCYGNPRCTGFSCVTAGYGQDTHGPWAKQTQDIHQLCHYGVDNGFDVVCWESVQQAYTTGRELLDHLRDDVFVPNGYRICHLKLNAASFDNAQRRKRYFFVAYRRGRAFNAVPPAIDYQHATVWDAIGHLRNRETREQEGHHDDHPDAYVRLTENERHIVSRLNNGWSLNLFARHRYGDLPEPYKRKWDTRESEMPFSMHCLCRLNWLSHCPTLSSSCSRLVHPEHHRPITIREAAALMGWPKDVTPIGKKPFGQIAKGIVPAIGEWLAQQVTLYLEDAWGGEDWESAYSPHAAEWRGRDAHDLDEKTIDMTHYHGHVAREHEGVICQPHKYLWESHASPAPNLSKTRLPKRFESRPA